MYGCLLSPPPEPDTRDCRWRCEAARDECELRHTPSTDLASRHFARLSRRQRMACVPWGVGALTLTRGLRMTYTRRARARAAQCTWGFHSPTEYPEENLCGDHDVGVALIERGNSTTCPRQMLCDYNTRPDGSITKPITWCNIEGYNGMDQKWLGATRHMLSKMPAGRCPYPPGDRPGMLGFDTHGHYIGGA